nr:MAG TPA: hypothetical protein [Caudoviricetes sp.]
MSIYPPRPLVLPLFGASPLLLAPKHSKLPDILLFNKVQLQKVVAFRGGLSVQKNVCIIKKVVSPPPCIAPP